MTKAKSTRKESLCSKGGYSYSFYTLQVLFYDPRTLIMIKGELAQLKACAHGVVVQMEDRRGGLRGIQFGCSACSSWFK